MLAGLVSPEASFLALETVAFLLCLHMAFSLSHAFLVSLPLLLRTPVRLLPTLTALFDLHYLPEGPISKYSHTGAQGFNIGILGGHHSVRNRQ